MVLITSALVLMFSLLQVLEFHRFSNVTELRALKAAVNAIRANGGGDCLELGMTGILNALSLANPESNVIVLTDASPKDVDRTQEVIDRATQLQNSIHFFLSCDGCADSGSQTNNCPESRDGNSLVP